MFLMCPGGSDSQSEDHTLRITASEILPSGLEDQESVVLTRLP